MGASPSTRLQEPKPKMLGTSTISNRIEYASNVSIMHYIRFARSRLGWVRCRVRNVRNASRYSCSQGHESRHLRRGCVKILMWFHGQIDSQKREAFYLSLRFSALRFQLSHSRLVETVGCKFICQGDFRRSVFSWAIQGLLRQWAANLSIIALPFPQIYASSTKNSGVAVIGYIWRPWCWVN